MEENKPTVMEVNKQLEREAPWLAEKRRYSRTTYLSMDELVKKIWEKEEELRYYGHMLFQDNEEIEELKHEIERWTIIQKLLNAYNKELTKDEERIEMMNMILRATIKEYGVQADAMELELRTLDRALGDLQNINVNLKSNPQLAINMDTIGMVLGKLFEHNELATEITKSRRPPVPQLAPPQPQVPPKETTKEITKETTKKEEAEVSK